MESEEKLRHSYNMLKYFITHARSAIAIHDRDLRYLYVSNKYLEDYKIKDRDIIGKHHYEVFPDLPEKWREVHQLALNGIVSSSEEDPYHREDGTVEWTRWECRPWHEADGSIGGIIVNTEVITERKRTEEKMETMLKEIHHRVKNNLQIISSLLSLQSDMINSENYMEAFNESRSRIRSMAIIHEKLYQSGNFTHIDFGEYASEVISYLRKTYMSSAAYVQFELDFDKIELEIDTAIPCGLILNELISNAFKYAFPTNIPGVLTCRIKKDPDHISISIKDTGPGIPENKSQKLTDTLGLMLVNTLVSQLKGSMHVCNDQGAEFNIKIPIKN